MRKPFILMPDHQLSRFYVLKVDLFMDYFKTCFRNRNIYRVIDKNVYVLLIVDSRRDMQALLQRRLLGD